MNAFFTTELEKAGFVREDRAQHVGEWTILPSVAFDPVYGFGGYHIKSETYSIHRYSASWEDTRYRVKGQFVEKYAPLIGRRPAQVVGRLKGEVCMRLSRKQNNA